ncbi:hypothetical protein PQX77_010480 [Marasmius sp. AFHP31]|nr:hypothetical protein PQX77_010480 [Marasmius sp. AFHP31]
MHVPPTSSMTQRQLLGKTGRKYTMEKSAQSIAPVLREQLNDPVPKLVTILQSQDSAEDGSGRISLDEVVERAVLGLRSQLAAVTQRVAQLESELAESAPPDYASNPSELSVE